MTEREFLQSHMAEMALIQGDYFLRNQQDISPERSMPSVVCLMKDCVRYLNLSDYAVEFALNFHPVVERWASWSLWAPALDELLGMPIETVGIVNTIRLLNCRSQTARELSDTPTAHASAISALNLATDHKAYDLMVASLNKLGRIAVHHDDLATARRYWEQAFSLSAAIGTSIELGHLCTNLGNISTLEGDMATAEQYFNQALRHYQAADDQFHIAKVHCNIADLQNRSGQLSDVPAALIEARDIFKTLGARYDYGLAENDIGYIYLKLQKYQTAHQAFEVANQMFESLGSMSARALVLSNLGELYVAMKDWRRAEATLAEARELAVLCEKPLLVIAIDIDYATMVATLESGEGAERLDGTKKTATE